MIHANRFAGKTAVVTGAAQGIGRDVALRLAQEGCSVALVDRSDLVEQVRNEAETAGAPAIAIIADLETFAGASAAVGNAGERFGRIDILINNVGGTIWAKPYAAYEPEQIESEIRRSLFPTLWCCRAVLPAMVQAGSLCRGQGRSERHHRQPGHGVCRAWNSRLRRGSRGHRGAPTAYSSQRRAAIRTRSTVVPAGRRSDGLIQSDEAIRHHRGTGRGDPVPGLRRGFLHHRRNTSRRRRGYWLTKRKSRRT